jgi:type II secretory ATPase GspE/PulE/Tfp pilus assembly ATPase PilB-like protein
LRNAALVNDIAAAAVGAGMVALSAEVIRVAAEGRTSLREALRVLASV